MSKNIGSAKQNMFLTLFSKRSDSRTVRSHEPLIKSPIESQHRVRRVYGSVVHHHCLYIVQLKVKLTDVIFTVRRRLHNMVVR